MASINLAEFVEKPFRHDAYFNYEKFGHAVRVGIRCLDDIIDENLNKHPLEEQRVNTALYRNCGLGTFGLAGCLFKLGIEYGSEDSILFVDNLYDLMFREAVMASVELAAKRGAYPAFKPCVWDSKIMKRHFDKSELAKLRYCKLRNCSLLSIAPNGTTATILRQSGGVEPEFALNYKRTTKSLNKDGDKDYSMCCEAVEAYFDTHVGATELPYYFVTSGDINWRDRIKIQAAMQNHIDTAISSTINLPHDISVEEIEEIYLEAWKAGLKGITIFRDGCKRVGILTTGNKDQKEEKKASTKLQRGDIVDADDNLVGKKRKLITGCGSLHCTAFFDPDSGEARETYFSKGSTGGCNNFMIALSRLISLAVRGGIDINTVFDQLQSCGTCPSYATRKAVEGDTSKGSCCPSAIGYALKEMYEEMVEQVSCDEEEFAAEKEIAPESGVKCPECGANLIFTGGCNSCPECGYSKCS